MELEKADTTLSPPAVVQVASRPEPVVSVPRADNELARWQRRVLPLMSGFLIILAGYFIVSSEMQARQMQRQIESIPDLDMNKALKEIHERHARNQQPPDLEQIRWDTRALLEAHALNRRYNQAKIVFVGRIWTRFFGFVTGMTLALVGAAFVLGKLQDSGSTLSADGSLWKGSLATASPGIVLAVLGSALMLTTISIQGEYAVDDAAVYLPEATVETVTPTPLPRPAALPSVSRPSPSLATKPSAAYGKNTQDKIDDVLKEAGLKNPEQK